MRNPLVVQWLGLHAFTAEGARSVPDGGTKIPQVACAAKNDDNKIKQNRHS